MKEKSSNVVQMFKYTQANEDFVTQLSEFIREQAITLTQADNLLEGAVVYFSGSDSIKTVRFGITPERIDFLAEVSYSYH